MILQEKEQKEESKDGGFREGGGCHLDKDKDTTNKTSKVKRKIIHSTKKKVVLQKEEGHITRHSQDGNTIGEG
jgi:hypothetical protein